MAPKPSYFEQAAEVLEQAMRASGLAEQALLLDEALRLNRLGQEEERAKLNKIKAWVFAPADKGPAT